MSENILQFGEKRDDMRDRPGAYAVIIQNEKILAVINEGLYHLPGGGIDPGETAKEAVLREVLEETGYKSTIISEIGKANQYHVSSQYGPINKKGVYYEMTVDTSHQDKPLEEDDVPVWITLEEYFKKAAHVAHPWAVKKFLGIL